MAIRRIMGLALAGTVGFAGQSRAQSIDFQGSTTGCFYTTVVCAPVGGDQYLFLKFLAGTFNQATSDPGGVAALGSATSNLGFFELGKTKDVYSGEKFLLKILFDAPTMTGPNAVYTAAVLGTVSTTGGGGVAVVFGNPQTFAFNGPDYTGSFQLKVNSLSVSPGTLESQTAVPVTAYITTSITGTTSVPEPGTAVLFSTGLLGVLPISRFRRRTPA